MNLDQLNPTSVLLKITQFEAKIPILIKMRVFLTFSFLLLQLCLEKLIQERHFLLPRGQLFTTQNYNRKRLSEFKPNLLHPGIMFTTVISFFFLLGCILELKKLY